jgi:hypothetical protein
MYLCKIKESKSQLRIFFFQKDIFFFLSFFLFFLSPPPPNTVHKVYSAVRRGVQVCHMNYSYSKLSHLWDCLHMCKCVCVHTHTLANIGNLITHQFLGLLVSGLHWMYSILNRTQSLINQVILNRKYHHQNCLELILLFAVSLQVHVTELSVYPQFCCCIHINFWYFTFISDSSNSKFVSQVCLVTGYWLVWCTANWRVCQQNVRVSLIVWWCLNKLY